MGAIKFKLVGAGLAFSLTLLINASFGHTGYYVCLYNPCFWSYGGRQGYYRWLDNRRYMQLDKSIYACSPFWPAGQFQPYPYYNSPWQLNARIVAVERPLLIEERPVIVEQREYCEKECKLLELIREKKNEWFRKIEDGNKEDRTEAVKNLSGFVFDPPVRTVLEKVLLSDPESDVRKEAAKALGKVNNTRALAALRKARATDSDEQVRQEANKAIMKIQEEYLEKLREAERLFSEKGDEKAHPSR
jgi:hypothetical protein